MSSRGAWAGRSLPILRYRLNVVSTAAAGPAWTHGCPRRALRHRHPLQSLPPSSHPSRPVSWGAGPRSPLTSDHRTTDGCRSAAKGSSALAISAAAPCSQPSCPPSTDHLRRRGLRCIAHVGIGQQRRGEERCPRLVAEAAARSSWTELRLIAQPARVWRCCCAECASSFKVMSLPSMNHVESGQTHALKSPTTRPQREISDDEGKAFFTRVQVQQAPWREFYAPGKNRPLGTSNRPCRTRARQRLAMGSASTSCSLSEICAYF